MEPADAGRAGGRGRVFLAVFCAWALGGVLAPTPAAAQPSSTAAAESLFNEGRELMKQGDFPAACEKFAASHALEGSVGALLNLGDCREKNQQLASAWVAYRQAAALAQRDGDARRARVAQRHADRLAPQLSYLVIEIPDASRLPGLSITRDGEVVEEPLWGQRAPVDAGAHQIRVEAPGHVPQTLAVTVAPGSKEVHVSVPVLAKAPVDEGPGDASTAPGNTSQTGGDGAPAAGLDRSLDDGGGLSTGRMVAIGGGVVGLAGVATGVIFALRSQDRWDQARANHCNELNQCDPQGLALAREASDAATISNISYGIGVAVLAGSVALWFLSPTETGAGAGGEHDDSAAGGATWRPLAITPIVGPDRAGLTLEGRF